MKAGDLEVRQAREDDLPQLKTFRCSTGEPWENLVEEQIRGPLAARYLSSPAAFDGRLLVGFDRGGHLLVVGAHRIEPTLVPDVGYVEVIAVALDVRGTLVEMPRGEELSLGHFMLATIFRQMVRLGRHSRTFRSRGPPQRAQLGPPAPCRLDVTHELPDPHDSQLVQRWGELGQ